MCADSQPGVANAFGQKGPNLLYVQEGVDGDWSSGWRLDKRISGVIVDEFVTRVPC